MEYLGYFAAVIIGTLLGLIGAGGSILTIPVLVYLIGIQPINAMSYSLFIVGISAFIGGLSYLKNNMVCLKTMMVFGFPSVLSIFLQENIYCTPFLIIYSQLVLLRSLKVPV